MSSIRIVAAVVALLVAAACIFQGAVADRSKQRPAAPIAATP